MSEPPEPSPEPSVPASPEPAQTNPPEAKPPEPSTSEPPEAASSLRIPVPPEDWDAPVFEWDNYDPGLIHVDFTFWREEADGWQFVTGLYDEQLPLPAEEAEEETSEEPKLYSPDRPPGYWRHLTWPGLELLCYHCGPERDVVMSITVTDPEIVTFRGVHVGCTLEDLLATQVEGQAGGTGDPNLYTYTYDWFTGTHAPRLFFLFEDGVITHIHVEYFNGYWGWDTLLPAEVPEAPNPSEPPEAASTLRIPVPPEDWDAPVFEWENEGNHGPGVWHVDFTFWREEADGWQFFTGLHDEKLPLPVEEAEEESWEEPKLISPSLPSGYWRHLTWPGLELLCYHCGPERDVAVSITITDPEIVTFRGVHVGCTLEDLLATQEDGQVWEYYRDYYYNKEPGIYVYTPNLFAGTHAPRLLFRFEDGVITHIHLEYFNANWGWDTLLPADE